MGGDGEGRSVTESYPNFFVRWAQINNSHTTATEYSVIHIGTRNVNHGHKWRSIKLGNCNQTATATVNHQLSL